MARRVRTSSIALPWERQGSRLREVFTGGRWRWAVLVLAAAIGVYGIFVSVEEREKERRTR
jgi:hypothetical protein